MSESNLIYYGSAIKDLGGGRIGGYLVLFGDADNTDLERDFFTADTDFGEAVKTDVWFNHRLPLKTANGKSIAVRERIGQGELKIDGTGVLIEAVLHNRAEYESMLDKLGWSSGTAEHLVDREQVGKAYHITRWPLGLDASLTPTPAEPRAQAIPLKSIQDVVLPTPEGDGESSETTEHNVNINIKVSEAITMSEETQAPVVEKTEKESPQTDNYATKDELKTLSDSITALVQRLERAPALKDAGYIAPDDEASKPEVKSFADFITAIYRGNHKRLTEVYKSRKDLSTEVGTAGGYLVPEAFENTLLEVAASASQLVNLVTSVPVTTDTGKWPSLDQYAAPTAGSGNTAFAGGITTAATAEGAALTETDATFEMIQWTINKIGGYTQVTNELVADSAMAVEVLLSRLFGVAVMGKKEQLILRGTGAGEPEGILNATAAVAVTPDTDNSFALADALEMISRFKPVGGSPVWVIHPGIWPDIGVFETSNGGGVFQTNIAAGSPNTLYGYPVLQSEHLPQDDNSGCVILIDPTAYVLFERSGLSIAFSEHFAFTSELGTWRFSQRFDGQSWLKSAITLADPQGSYTVSPFVYLND